MSSRLLASPRMQLFCLQTESVALAGGGHLSRWVSSVICDNLSFGSKIAFLFCFVFLFLSVLSAMIEHWPVAIPCNPCGPLSPR